MSKDVVVVGGGLAGSSLATVLARAGIGVLVLEKETRFKDRVRGENMLPWGVATARRAMSPIAELTETARTIERTRDPSRRIPHPEAEDEVAELARTLDGMLHALDQARSETEATLARQREFVADASHELRTPLTSVLANLELLEEVLQG